jgi:hypothetical protein
MNNLKYFEVKKLPIVVIDNFYNEKELSLIMNEINLLHQTNEFMTPEESGSAFNLINGEKIYKKNNVGIVLDDIYSNRNISNILTVNRKIFSDDLIKELIDLHYFFKILKILNYDITKLHYYSNNSDYKMHYDDCIISATSWFYNYPKKFIGGNLLFEDNVEVECIHNRTAIFPSILNHCVTQVVLNENESNEKNGRYSVNQFIKFNFSRMVK